MTVADPFGELMLQWHRTGAGTEFIERSDGLLSASDPGRYFNDYESWPAMDRRLIDYAAGEVLDVGCGAGRHALYLQRQGFAVTGIDQSPGCVTVSRSRGLRRAHERDINDIHRIGRTFDTFLMLGNNLGLLGNREAAPRLLRKMAKVANPDACILGTNVDYRSRIALHRKYHAANRNAGRLPGTIRIRVRHENVKGEWFDYLFTTPQELKRLLKDTPWKLAETFTDDASPALGHRLTLR